MNKIKIVTDSTADVNQELINKLDLEIVPLYVKIGDDVYRDFYDITPETLFDEIDKKEVMPKTSATPPTYFEKVFKKYVDQGYDVIYCGLGSKFSSTFNNALLASQNFDNVFCIDSLNLSSSTALILLKIDALRSKGMSAKEIKTYCEKYVVPNVRCSFAIDTMEYLHKGGRCSSLTLLIGSLLKIKPIISVIDGEMKVTKKPLGKISKAIRIILDDIVAIKDKIDNEFLFSVNCISKEVSNSIFSQIKESLPNIKNIIETNAGCVIASHCGPKAVGLIYLLKP